jgi:hypothetical protein
MAALVDVYTNAVYVNLRPLRANWEPSQPIALGDYGTLKGDAFERLGNVTSLGLEIGETIDDDVGDQKIFSSGGNTSVNFHAKGSATQGVAPINANIEIAFAAADAAFFNAAGCSYSMIKEKSALGDAIMKQFNDAKWRREWAVVTDLVKAKSTTVVISSSTGGSIVLEADAKFPQIDLANADIGLTLKSARNIGYQVISKNGLSPLICLSKIQPKFWIWGDQFKPLTTRMLLNSHLTSAMEDSPTIRTESKEDLYFGQLS